MRKQQGFAVVEIVLVLVLLLGVAAVGYKVMSARKTANKTVASTDKSTVPAAQTVSGVPDKVPQINKSSDLDTAASTVDKTDVDSSSSDLTQLDAQLNNL